MNLFGDRPHTCDPIRHLLCRSGGGDGELLVALQRLDPPADIGGVVLDGGGHDPGMPAQKRGSHLRDQLFTPIVGRAERGGVGVEAAIQPGAMPGGVGQLMEERAVVIRGRRKAGGLGDVHGVVLGQVVRAGAAMLDDGASGVSIYDPLGLFNR